MNNEREIRLSYTDNDSDECNLYNFEKENNINPETKENSIDHYQYDINSRARFISQCIKLQAQKKENET
jgi:hypothetical protein